MVFTRIDEKCRRKGDSFTSIAPERTYQADGKIRGVATESLFNVTRNLLMVSLACDKGGTKDGRNEGSNDFHSEKMSEKEPCGYDETKSEKSGALDG